MWRRRHIAEKTQQSGEQPLPLHCLFSGLRRRIEICGVCRIMSFNKIKERVAARSFGFLPCQRERFLIALRSITKKPSCSPSLYGDGVLSSQGEALPRTETNAEGEAVGGRGGSLGIYRQRETKTEETPEQPRKIERKKDLREYTEEERERWKRAKQQENAERAAIARKWIAETETKNGRTPAICQCGRAIKGEMAGLYLTEDARIYNEHLQCRSWACPICAHKRAWARTLELEQAILAAAARDYRQLFITFTIPHTASQKTKTVLRHLNDAYHRFRQDRTLKKCLASFGFVGQIKSLDFTFTENGVHAHFHTVWIFDTAEPLEAVAAECYRVMLDAWDDAVMKETGRHISRKYGFDVEMIEIPVDDTEAAEALALYTAKVISIYAASTNKDKGSLTPFDLLDLDQEEENKPIWQDYYKGSKGVRRIVFSRGLKARLGVEPTEYEKPQQASVATISPAHTDFLRHEQNRQQLEQMLTHRRATEAVEWLREIAPAPIFVNNELIAALDADALFITRAEQIQQVVAVECERAEQMRQDYAAAGVNERLHISP